jgi:hypothetical protein
MSQYDYSEDYDGYLSESSQVNTSAVVFLRVRSEDVEDR